MFRILLVEDEFSVRKMIAVNLMLNGYAVTEAVNGKEAIELAIENPPDLLITDLAMPVQDGTELLDQFKKSDKLKNIPIIVLSAVANLEPVQQLTKWAGADTFIQKPFEWPVLSAAINKKLKK